MPGLADVRQVVGLSLAESIRRLAGEHDPGESEVAAVVAGYRQAFAALYGADPARDPLFPLTREMLDSLDGQGRLLGVATGKSRGGVETILRGHGLLERFLTVQTPDTNPGKPHPGMVDSAMAALGVEPHRTVLVGDSVYDMEMAVNAGIAGVGVSWGYHEPEALAGAGAVAVLDSFADLPELVDGLLAEAG